ncbi:MAG: 30S ribosomal protein S1 [Deltaproteobacteria bacterium RIFOXYA12_FULL_61_11]|nr:MAG: 30S ribosomal protein S1 [Deltaproteobacteria bacterium RIFOXYA12_FULL_61_11]
MTMQFEKKLNEKYPDVVYQGGDNFAALLEEKERATQKFRSGEVVHGRIVKMLKDTALVDIGYKSEGLIPLQEFANPDGTLTIKEGDEIDVYLENTENRSGNLVLSKEKAESMKIWDEIAIAFENDQLVEGRIVERVKGGLSVSIGVKAFLPGSQIDLTPVRNLDALLGNVYKFKIIKFNKKRANIVLSRRALLEKEREQLKKETLKILEEGVILRGIVKNITEYGAFVDLGGIDGLLHITDISWGRVNHPSDVFSIGDEIKVKILKFDRETERVSLGLKQTTPDPWELAAAKYKIGDKVNGKIVSITDYGAFVELEQGIEGLIHISEMSWIKRVKHPSKMVALGDAVEVMILDVIPEKRRISLGMKQLEPNPWERIAQKYPIGSVVSGKIKNMTEFGLFIGLEEGVDGLVHISDLSWTRKVKHPSELFPKGRGQDIEAKVLNVDIEHERFALGIKQLSRDPWIDVHKMFEPSQMVEGMVDQVSEAEGIVLLENDIEGLVPGRELWDDENQPKHPEFKQGEKIKLYVRKVDEKDRRVALSFSLPKPKGAKGEESAKSEETAAAVEEPKAVILETPQTAPAVEVAEENAQPETPPAE